MLAALAESAAAYDLTWDRYGEHGPVEQLESELTDLFGTEDAAFFPSGTMAQQCVLRTWCDRAGTPRVALPDLAHLLVHEAGGPALLHGFRFEHLTTGRRTPDAEALAAIPGRLAAVMVELPLRDAGCLLPTWDELVALSAATRARGAAFHVDGARLWESQPSYDRSYAELAALADTTYVSFYKGLGGIAGAALVGPADVLAEARLWRQADGRHAVPRDRGGGLGAGRAPRGAAPPGRPPRLGAVPWRRSCPATGSPRTLTRRTSRPSRCSPRARPTTSTSDCWRSWAASGSGSAGRGGRRRAGSGDHRADVLALGRWTTTRRGWRGCWARSSADRDPPPSV